MPTRPEPQPGILKIAPYVPGKTRLESGATPIKLSSNESPLGMSPKAAEAIASVAGLASLYPDGSSASLRNALGDVHGLDPARIVPGAGSDELLHLLAQTYLGSGDEAIVSEFGFLVYPIATLGAGATPVFAKDRDYTVSVDNMLAAVTPNTKIVWLANPNNPTGTYLPASEVRRLQAGLRPDILIVIDNAYAEYVTAGDFETGADLVRESENTVMVRTFSKVGLAGLRIGWLYGPREVVDAVNRLRGPFNINVTAQLAGEAAARDAGFSAKLCAHNAQWRDWLASEISSNQIRVLPSQANFILALFAEGPGLTAADANRALSDKNIIVREMAAYGMPNALRISIGTESDMRAVAAVLGKLQEDQNV